MIIQIHVYKMLQQNFKGQAWNLFEISTAHIDCKMYFPFDDNKIWMKKNLKYMFLFSLESLMVYSLGLHHFTHLWLLLELYAI